MSSSECLNTTDVGHIHRLVISAIATKHSSIPGPTSTHVLLSTLDYACTSPHAYMYIYICVVCACTCVCVYCVCIYIHTQAHKLPPWTARSRMHSCSGAHRNEVPFPYEICRTVYVCIYKCMCVHTIYLNHISVDAYMHTWIHAYTLAISCTVGVRKKAL